MARRLGARSGPVATAQVSRPHLACRIACLFGATRCQAETAVTFVARSLCVGETAVTFVARSLCVGETAITFARSKCVFLRHCGRAKVSLVSRLPLDARAVVSRVSLGRHLCAVVCSKGPSTSCHLPVGLAWWNVPSVAGFGQWIMGEGGTLSTPTQRPPAVPSRKD